MLYAGIKSVGFVGILVSITIFYKPVEAQTLYRQSGDSFVTISGTSTLHEWTMTSKEVKCTAHFEANADGTPAKLSGLKFSLRSESLKSGHNAMDRNAYVTLDYDTYKQITFDLTSADVFPSKISFSGNLTVAGFTKLIKAETTYKVLPDKSLVISGSKKLLMSELNIEPPSFMFGTVITGDEITISFKLSMSPK